MEAIHRFAAQIIVCDPPSFSKFQRSLSIKMAYVSIDHGEWGDQAFASCARNLSDNPYRVQDHVLQESGELRNLRDDPLEKK